MLYQEAVRTPIFNVMIIISVISCVAAVIPILFYDMTEKRQQQIIEDLKARAAEEDRRAETQAAAAEER